LRLAERRAGTAIVPHETVFLLLDLPHVLVFSRQRHVRLFCSSLEHRFNVQQIFVVLHDRRLRLLDDIRLVSQ